MDYVNKYRYCIEEKQLPLLRVFDIRG